MSNNRKLEIKILSSLAKVFADECPKESQWDRGSMLLNEVYSFQVAYWWSGCMIVNVCVSAESGLKPWISLRTIGLVPSEMPCYGDHDDNVLRTVPGLYPDPLIPVSDEGITLLPEQWRSIWITVDPRGEAKSDIYKIMTVFSDNQGNDLGSAEFELELINMMLPAQTLIHTEWFHTDCLATWYGLDIFSEEHWMRIEQYICTAVKHGINMILTPVFTPPLDTAVGEERPTVQLIDVEKSYNTYNFRFEKLKRWVDLCRANGVEYFEISHLFTQWGAKHAPKVMAYENGEYKRIFGWDTDADGEAYKNFLACFLPKLVDFIESNSLEKSVYFHVSDEPSINHLENYRSASSILKEYIQKYPVIDALSDYTFYETGLVQNPVAATNHIDIFIENNVPNLWTYYCCSQYKLVSNRFFNMPSERNRIIGIQLYKFNIFGFLQWGYNFWYSQYSRYPVDPFKVTDSGCAFPSGDPFVVYPGKDGPLESLRLEVFYEAIQDLRALKLLESLIGRDEVLNMLEEGLDKPITFSQYPTDPVWLLAKREQINEEICRNIKK